MPELSSWQRFSQRFIRYPDLSFSLDTSLMNYSDQFLAQMLPLSLQALDEMRALEAGDIVNADENRMVGHYWLRNASLAPTPELRRQIKDEITQCQDFAAKVHEGIVVTPRGEKFTDLLLVGIGGSALGPQLVVDALTNHQAKLRIHFFDNTDPEGMDKILAGIGDRLATTLTLVISKSGGTKETRNGMLEAENAYRALGLNFPRHAIAVTGPGSVLDEIAASQGWLERFPMSDWVGGRTSVMSTVGLIPAALLGVDVRAFLQGAAAMDEKTRGARVEDNASLILALMWHHAGQGKGLKDMVVLPYKDQLMLMSKYLQQLVMESLGKELDRDGNQVNQGIAVYGNKGSTDQHAYVQQLRDGVNNFFVTFIEVREARQRESREVEAGFTTGDYLQGFLRGTRQALADGGRESITVSIPRVDAYNLGLLIAFFERAVGFYATLVNINAYHQPGVESGKKAAGTFLSLLTRVRQALPQSPVPMTAAAIAQSLGAREEDVYHCLVHCAANDKNMIHRMGTTPAEDLFAPASVSLP